MDLLYMLSNYLLMWILSFTVYQVICTLTETDDDEGVQYNNVAVELQIKIRSQQYLNGLKYDTKKKG